MFAQRVDWMARPDQAVVPFKGDTPGEVTRLINEYARHYYVRVVAIAAYVAGGVEGTHHALVTFEAIHDKR